MKLIINQTELQKEFNRLIKQYKDLYWTVAWAGTSFNESKQLKKYAKKIKKIIIGTHFYQTNPEFIEAFISNRNVKYVKRTDELFHPKMYLFSNGEDDWEMLLGSANFTQGAFNSNTEVVALISSNDTDSMVFYNRATGFVNKIWEDASYFTLNDLAKYKLTWKSMKAKRESLSGKYGAKKSGKPIYEAPILNMSWKEYLRKVKDDKNHGLDERLEILTKAQQMFATHKHFNVFSTEDRKAVAGFSTIQEIDWGLFGSMKGAGDFKHEVNSNNKYISLALDQIPLEGSIKKAHYESFVDHYEKVSSTRNWIATSTRLLAMKRPDVFVCLDERNRKKLCEDFGIVQVNMNYSRYWNEVIERIFDSEWWNVPCPMDDLGKKIYGGRSALLDVLYYEPKK